MTAQVPELMSYEGLECPLLCQPDLPGDEPRLVRVSDTEARESESMVFSTACWRNYVAEWSVERGRLYLSNVRGIYRLNPGPPLFAEWFTGTLRMAVGGLVDYFHGGYGSRFEREFFAEIRNGVVVRTWNESNYLGAESRDDGDA